MALLRALPEHSIARKKFRKKFRLKALPDFPTKQKSADSQDANSLALVRTKERRPPVPRPQLTECSATSQLPRVFGESTAPGPSKAVKKNSNAAARRYRQRYIGAPGPCADSSARFP